MGFTFWAHPESEDR